MIKDKFFSAEEIKTGVWQITNCFNSHARMNTFCYLVEGETRALVIDTMYGYGDLAAFCRALTDKPLTLVCTHYHGDHAGGCFDFDECYLHALDIPFMLDTVRRAQKDPTAYREARFNQMKNASLPEYADMILPTDVSMVKPMYFWPIWDGDSFDLGGKVIEVVHVGGHTPGEIVLVDRADRICFTGDACNDNTLLSFPGGGCLSVEEYSEFLAHFKTLQAQFDICYGGHIVAEPSIIDEGIETVARVLARTDDKEPSTGFGGRTCLYGGLRKPGTFIRENGMRFNIAYTEENVYKTEKKPRVY